MPEAKLAARYTRGGGFYSVLGNLHTTTYKNKIKG